MATLGGANVADDLGVAELLQVILHPVLTQAYCPRKLDAGRLGLGAEVGKDALARAFLGSQPPFVRFLGSFLGSTCRFSRTGLGKRRVLTVDRGGELVAVAVVGELDGGPVVQGAANAGAEAAVGQQALGGQGDQDGVAGDAGAGADLGHGQVVGQMARADDLDAVGEDEDADGRADQVVAVDQGVGDQLLEDDAGDGRLALGVDTLVALDLGQAAHDEGQSAIALLAQGAAEVLGIEVALAVDGGAGIADRLDQAGRLPALRVLREVEDAGQIQLAALGGQVQVLDQNLAIIGFIR